MKENNKRLIGQIASLSAKGKLGDAAQLASQDYSTFQESIPRLVKYILEFYSDVATDNQQIAQVRDNFCQCLIVIYREVKKQNLQIARAFVNSFIEDYPGVENSALLQRWTALCQAALAYKEGIKSQNEMFVWQQSSRLILAYNEFLNGLLGYLIIAWRCVEGKRINTNVFGNAYGDKVNQFADLTNGENGAFYLIHRLAKPKLRNAIAHEMAWLDIDSSKVRYINGRVQKIEYEMDVTEFFSYAMLGSHFGSAYLAALATIVVMEDGGAEAKGIIPPHLIRVFKHVVS